VDRQDIVSQVKILVLVHQHLAYLACQVEHDFASALALEVPVVFRAYPAVVVEFQIVVGQVVVAFRDSYLWQVLPDD